MSYKGELNPNWKGGKSKCCDCGVLLRHRYSQKKEPRCRGCFIKFHSGKNHWNYRGGMPKCPDCGKTLGDWASKTCIQCRGKRFSGVNSPVYKKKLSYKYLHIFIGKTYGHPDTCEHCGKTGDNRMIQWANKSGEYRRDREDWLRLCVSCHKKYDSRN